MKDYCFRCSWNDCDYGCTCPANEEVYQCELYRAEHPNEVQEFEEYCRRSVNEKHNQSN